MSIPLPDRARPEIAVSADEFKFAIAIDCGVSVWDIRSKVPLQTFTELWDTIRSKVQTFMELPLPMGMFKPRQFLQFTSGNLGKEILIFVEVRLMFTF